MKKLIITAAVLCAAQGALAQGHHEMVFSEASELMPWCQKEASGQLGSKGVATHGWSARHYSKDNLLIVEGQIRTDKGDVPVTCRVARGGKERYAVAEVGKK